MKKNSQENENRNQNNLSFEQKVAKELIEIHEKIDMIYEFSLGIVGTTAAAKLLNISKGHLYQLTATKKIPFYKRAKLNYFIVEELIDWIKKEDHKRKNGTVVEESRVDQLMLENLN